MKKEKNKNSVNHKRGMAMRIFFALFTLALCLPYSIIAQQRIIAERHIDICQGAAPINLNKTLGINVPRGSGNWYNASGEKISNVFVFPTQEVDDKFSFYFLLESSNVYCGLQKNDRYNVTLVIAEVPQIILSEVVQPTCEKPFGSVRITNYNPVYSYKVYPENLNIDGTGLISNAKPGVTYSVLASNGTCSSSVVSFAVNDLPADCKEYKGPTTVDDERTTTPNTAITIPILDNDIEGDNSIDVKTVVIVTQPKHGTVKVHPVTGTVEYTPNTDYTGTDSFTYTVKDSKGIVSNVATVTIHIAKKDSKAPTAVDDDITTPKDTPVTIPVLDNDKAGDEPIDLKTVTIITAPSHGMVEVHPVTGTVKYIPDRNYVGIDSFTYTVKDSEGNISNVATVTIQVGDKDELCIDIWDGLEFYQIITPNNDGKNDKFVIGGILDYYDKDCEPNVKLMIFNRWGAKVYESVNYMKDGNYFEGYSDNSLDFMNNKLLPAGTYFYIFESQGRLSKTGYFYITEP